MFLVYLIGGIVDVSIYFSLKVSMVIRRQLVLRQVLFACLSEIQWDIFGRYWILALRSFLSRCDSTFVKVVLHVWALWGL